MTSKSPLKTSRRIALAGRAAAIALAISCLTVSCLAALALAAAPDAANNQQRQFKPPQSQQQPKQQQFQQLQPKRQLQPKLQPKQQVLPKQQLPQQKQRVNQIQPAPEAQFQNQQQPKLKAVQPAPQQKQVQIQHFDWNTYHPGQRPPLWQQYRVNFDPRPYQWNRQAPRVYYVTVYRPPPGWRYRRWSYGQILPPAYWAQPYWLTNYSAYGLEPPPYGYVWVRNGPDAMSVDVVTGLILNVVYGLFSGGGGLF